MVRSASGVTTITHLPGRDRLCADSPGEGHADRAHVVAEHLAEIVGVDLADVGRSPTEARHSTHGVGRRTTAHLDRTGKRCVQLDRTLGLDQGHRALHELLPLEEVVRGVGDHVDERIADADDVVAGSVG